MNENIENLAIKAGFKIDKLGLASDGINHGIELEYFARLLIKECINVTANTACQATINDTFKGDDVPTFIHQTEIRKYFGIK